jgi:hypothetical protein
MPHWCKIVGLILFGLVVLIWVVFLIKMGNDPGYAQKHFSESPKILGGIDLILLAVSLLMLAFSREKDEDEYVASVRGKYLIIAFYLDTVFLILGGLTVSYHQIFVRFVLLQMFLILFLHIVMFNTAMAIIRRRRGHEE